MVDFYGFNIIIDDVVMADGTTRMGELGGGGPQTVFGMRLWSQSVGLAASVGPDIPHSALSWLVDNDVNLDAITYQDAPTPRAWQIIEADDHRLQIWRIPDSAVDIHLTHSLKWIPPDQRKPIGFHFGINPCEIDYGFIEDLKATGALVSIETATRATRNLCQDEFMRMVNEADIFSLNLEEAQSMLGFESPINILKRVISAGAKIVLLRMGADGSLVGVQGSKEIWRIPAVPVNVVNPVGAGNAFCGGFLAGYGLGKDIQRAAGMAAVSASFIIEKFGIPDITEELIFESENRLETEMKRITSI